MAAVQGEAASCVEAAKAKTLGHAAAERPEYKTPEWAGVPGVRGLAIELIVSGQVRERIPLDVEAHSAFCFGRAQTCDVVLDALEPRASRYHCILQCKAGCPELYIYDLQSSHGTSVNGTRIEARAFVPVRVGSHLRFNADKPTAKDCVAVICGPEEAMDEEGEVDLAAFRHEAARERIEIEKQLQVELARRKEAKKKRLFAEAQRNHDDAQRKATITALAERAKKHMQDFKAFEAEGKEKLQEVTWGMGEDAVETHEAEQDAETEKLMDSFNHLDPEKVRKLKLTDKQEQMLQKIEQKLKKVHNLRREKGKLEGQLNSFRSAKDMDTEFDVPEETNPRGGVNLEKANQIDLKLEKVDEELSLQTDNLLLSLGLRKVGAGGLSKRTAALYDTRDDDLEDDFFDRTVNTRKANDRSNGGADAEEDGRGGGEEASALAGLPTLDRVENQASLETKLRLFQMEKARLTVQVAAESAKQRSRAAAVAAAGELDSLDVFMTGTLDELRSDRRCKLQHRMRAVEERMAETEKLLRVARRNSEQPSPAPVASPLAAAAAAATAAAAAAVANAATARGAARSVGPSAETEAPETGTGSRQRSGVVSKAGAGGLADTLALLKEKGFTAPSHGGDSVAESDEGAANAVVEPGGTLGTSSASSHSREKRGPERPSAEMLAQASAPESTSPGSSASPAAPSAQADTPPLSAAMSAAELRAAALAAATRQRVPNAAHVDISKGGLQIMAPAGGRKRVDPAVARAFDSPAPPPPKKMYGAARGPPAGWTPAASRDADTGASGEGDAQSMAE